MVEDPGEELRDDRSKERKKPTADHKVGLRSAPESLFSATHETKYVFKVTSILDAQIYLP